MRSQESENSSGRCKREPAQGSQAFGDQGGVAGDEAQGAVCGAVGTAGGGGEEGVRAAVAD